MFSGRPNSFPERVWLRSGVPHTEESSRTRSSAGISGEALYWSACIRQLSLMDACPGLGRGGNAPAFTLGTKNKATRPKIEGDRLTDAAHQLSKSRPRSASK